MLNEDIILKTEIKKIVTFSVPENLFEDIPKSNIFTSLCLGMLGMIVMNMKFFLPAFSNVFITIGIILFVISGIKAMNTIGNHEKAFQANARTFLARFENGGYDKKLESAILEAFPHYPKRGLQGIPYEIILPEVYNNFINGKNGSQNSGWWQKGDDDLEYTIDLRVIEYDGHLIELIVKEFSNVK